MYTMSVIYLPLLFALFCSGEHHKNTLSVGNPVELMSSQALLQHRKFEIIKNPENLEKQEKSFKQIQNQFSKLWELSEDHTANNVTGPCFLSIEQVARDLVGKHLYAISMIDAWGKPPTGLLEGSLTWPGAFHECINADAMSFIGRYCLIKTGKTLETTIFVPEQPPELTVGGCFPSTCSQSNISDFLQRIYKNITVDCPVQYAEWKPRDILALMVCIILCLVIVSSSIYDYVSAQRSHQYSVLADDCQYHPNATQLQSVNHEDNVVTLFQYVVDHWEFQAVMNGTFCVDTFFFISGLLMTLLTLRNLTKNDGKMNVLQMYLHRYLRLTPVYAFVMLLLVSLWLKLGDGPLWPDMGETQLDLCEKYWYANLLYFSNLYPANLSYECYAIGWYLANDFQFYILAPIFIYALYRFPKLGLGLLSFVIVASIAVTGAFTVYTQQQPLGGSLGLIAWGVKSALSGNLSFNNTPVPSMPQYFDNKYSLYMSDVYSKPWCRISSYLIGMMMGYFLFLNSNKIKIPKVVVAVGWVVSATISCCVVYCLYPSFSTGQPLDFNVAALYNALSRPAWCVSLAWLIVACLNGYGGPVDKFLSWKGFLPLSRLTYCMYLSHPLVMYWLVLGGEGLLHFSIQTFILVFISTLILTTLVSFVIASCIEFPFVALAKVALSKDRNVPRVNEVVAYTRAQSTEEAKAD